LLADSDHGVYYLFIYYLCMNVLSEVNMWIYVSSGLLPKPRGFLFRLYLEITENMSNINVRHNVMVWYITQFFSCLLHWHVGFWEQSQPDPRSGECVDVTLADSHQSWELTTCESLLPFICRAAACPAGKSYHLSFCSNC
jgi:hypothetical protein